MTSLYPETTGIYFLSPGLKQVAELSGVLTLSERFAKEGYRVEAAGKLFHGNEAAHYFPKWAGSFGGFGPRPKEKISQPHMQTGFRRSMPRCLGVARQGTPRSRRRQSTSIVRESLVVGDR